MSRLLSSLVWVTLNNLVCLAEQGHLLIIALLLSRMLPVTNDDGLVGFVQVDPSKPGDLVHTHG